jgi:hypothetical protein
MQSWWYVVGNQGSVARMGGDECGGVIWSLSQHVRSYVFSVPTPFMVISIPQGLQLLRSLRITNTTLFRHDFTS